MDLTEYVESIQRQALVAAEAGGDEARAVLERLLPALEAAIRLTLQEALVAAAEEITCELAPGRVEVRLRGREPELIVTPVEPDMADGGNEDLPELTPGVGEDNATARINVRMPEQLKARVDTAASGEGLSVNSWLVRAAATALERGGRGRASRQAFSHGAQRYTGWGR